MKFASILALSITSLSINAVALSKMPHDPTYTALAFAKGVYAEMSRQGGTAQTGIVFKYDIQESHVSKPGAEVFRVFRSSNVGEHCGVVVDLNQGEPSLASSPLCDH